ncbi:hypothetical protein QBC38DRAFT_280406 [Podospora fimiseda]|uniref:F-box domain-containing protein n=1 Tax=Podospora fimiseda TaxID=252190 RepID=A0AAN7GUE8_9PEZI|nr:hypothetical protein QBC38DRAFT_280406 [Podospora fimiseda]
MPPSGSEKMSTRYDGRQKDLDPMVSGRLYNYQNSFLYKMPEEILVMIVNHLDPRDDAVARFCLARVAHLFRQHKIDASPFGTYWKEIIAEPRTDYLISALNSWGESRIVQEICRLLRKDKLCSNCLKFSKTSEGRALLDARRRHRITSQPPRPDCSGCGRSHNHLHFSAAQKRKRIGEGVCLGWEGHIKLCQHRRASWSDVEAALLASAIEGDSWKHYTTYELIRCEHPMHRSDCLASSPPSIKVRVWYGKAKIIVEWNAHTVLPINNQGRLDSRDVLAMFWCHQETGASSILLGDLKPSQAMHPRQMMCFGTDWCTCLSYDNGALEERDPAGVPGYKSCLGTGNVDKKDNRHRIENWGGKLEGDVGIKYCSESSTENEICLCTNYNKTIFFDLPRMESSKPVTRIIPSHEWLHGMDPNSYELDYTMLPCGSRGRWLKCKDVACAKY